MTAPDTADLSATLAGIKEHLRAAETGGLAEWSDGYIPSALYRSCRVLVAALEAVLAPGILAVR